MDKLVFFKTYQLCLLSEIASYTFNTNWIAGYSAFRWVWVKKGNRIGKGEIHNSTSLVLNQSVSQHPNLLFKMKPEHHTLVFCLVFLLCTSNSSVVSSSGVISGMCLCVRVHMYSQEVFVKLQGRP